MARAPRTGACRHPRPASQKAALPRNTGPEVRSAWLFPYRSGGGGAGAAVGTPGGPLRIPERRVLVFTVQSLVERLAPVAPYPAIRV